MSPRPAGSPRGKGWLAAIAASLLRGLSLFRLWRLISLLIFPEGDAASGCHRPYDIKAGENFLAPAQFSGREITNALLQHSALINGTLFADLKMGS